MKPFTTSQVAKIVGCSNRVVLQWIDSGKLKGYRVPATGSKSTGGHRRVELIDLRKFLTDNGIPLTRLDEFLGELR